MLSIRRMDDALRAERPRPGIPLDLTTDDALVRKALHLMQQSIDRPLSIEAIARRLGASRRQLERPFHHSVGMAPMLAYKILRPEHAEYLLKHSARSVTMGRAAWREREWPYCVYSGDSV